MADFYRAFPDLRIEIRNVIGSGTLIAAEYDLLGTHLGHFMGQPPTGHSFRIPVVSIYEHDGSLFTRETVYYDSASLLTQLGITSAA
jgi:predicted ester cyclase